MSAKYFRQAVRQGLIVGTVLVFLALIGALVVFSGKPIVARVLNLTQAILIGGALATGHLWANSYQVRKPAVLAVFGACSGAIAMLILAALALLVQTVNMRSVLVNATPQLVEVLSLHQGLGPGLVILVFIGVVFGAGGALWSLVPSALRGSLLTGALVLVSVGVLKERGLYTLTAAVAFIAVVIVTYVYTALKPRVIESYTVYQRRNAAMVRLIGIVVGLILLLILPNVLGIYGTSVVDLVGLYVLMGLGLNIVVGYAGLLDLGYVAFFAIGAYVTGLLTSPSSSAHLGLSFWIAWPVAMATAALAGATLGIPVLRMRGDYLAIVTLGFGEIIRILLLSDTFKHILGGAQGIIEIPSPAIGGFNFIRPQHFYYLILIGCVAVVLISRRISDSRIGRAWVAIREDEDVAEATGVNLVKYKLLAFAMGASFAGIGGAIFASWVHATFPNSFTLQVSINILSLIIVGGMGSIPGVIIGAFVLVGLPEVLREFADFRMLSFGALLVVMMLVRPQGLWPAQARRRELSTESLEV